ncbi:CIS tube protein [Geodermatophilus sp. SYSU D01176]
MEFVKATIEEVTTKPDAAPARVGDPIVVQINPATLRLQMASTVDFGKDTGRQKVQYQGSTSTLSFDLVFDTADEGTTEQPVDVRARTRRLERFVLPAMKQPKAVPPRLRFTYGSFSVIGVMTGLNQDFDFFAANGVPLRAKCAVTIKEQKPEFDATLAGPGANTGAGAVPPVPPGGSAVPGAGGGAPLPPPDRTGTAVAGESAPDFAGRMGLDPRAWKGLQGITDPRELPAGLRIDFAAALTPAAGLGVAVAAPPAAPPAGPPAAAVPPAVGVDGPALAAAGGVAVVLDRAAAANAAAAATATRSAFAPGPDPALPPADPGSPVPARPAPDPRALGYGFGVPLRPRLGAGRVARRALVTTGAGRGTAPPGATGRAAGGLHPPETDDPTVPRWRALPPDAGPAAAGPRSCCGGPR